MAESNEFCSNCKKYVGIANFASHSAFCHRNIVICKECKEPVPKNLTEEHEAESHIVVNCEWCSCSLKKWMLPQHQDICPKRPIICEFCDRDFPYVESEEHIHFCGSRTEKCPLCLKFIMFKEKQKHSKLCSKRPVTCEFCENDIPFDEFEVHIDRCGSYPEECSICSHYVLKKNKKEHLKHHQHEEKFSKQNRDDETDQNLANEFNKNFYEFNKNRNVQEYVGKSSEIFFGSIEKNIPIATEDFSSIVGATACPSEKSKQESDYTVCHICRLHILWEEYDSHVRTCSLIKCPKCESYVPSVALKEHFETVCQISNHLKAQSNRFESMTVERRSRFSDFENLPKERSKNSLSCPICKQMFPYDEIPEHVKSCPERYYQCQLCWEHLLQKDKDSHLSSNCKMLQKETLNNLYECPLCNEILPENEKSIHESFRCKVLLETNEGGLYSLNEEKVTKKHVEDTQKDSTEVCFSCKKKIAKHKMANHRQSCCKNSRSRCVYCDKEVAVGNEEYHLQHKCEVYPQIVKSMSSNEFEGDHYHKGAKPKQTKFSEMVKPKVARCCYCKTTLNDNILLFHERECVHQPIKCPDCSKTMPLKDVENHKCKPPLSLKGKDKGKGDRKNQKFEQPESRSSWLTSWLSGNKSNAKTLDQYQNEKNQHFEALRENKYTTSQFQSERKTYSGPWGENMHTLHQDRNNEDLYFAQPLIDDTNLPCEFCEKLFPASEIVLHMTGCNPQEASLPKQTLERPKENEGSSRQFKQTYDSSTDFFSAANRTFLPSTKYESINKRLEQKSNTKPGEYLNSYETVISSKSESNYQARRKQNQTSATFKSVWNNDSSDVEMEDADLETSARVQKVQEDIKEKGSDETKTQSAESDEEMINILESIEDKVPESTNVKLEGDNLSFTLDKQSKNHFKKDFPTHRSEIETESYGHSKRVSNNSADIGSPVGASNTYLSSLKPDHHKVTDFSSKRENSYKDAPEEEKEAYAAYILKMRRPSNEKAKETNLEEIPKEANEAYSSKFGSDFTAPKRDSDPEIGPKLYDFSSIFTANSVGTHLSKTDSRQNFPSSIFDTQRISSSNEKEKNHEEVSKDFSSTKRDSDPEIGSRLTANSVGTHSSKTDSRTHLSSSIFDPHRVRSSSKEKEKNHGDVSKEYNASKTDRNLKDEDPFKRAFKYIVDDEENSVQPDTFKKETVSSTNILQKMKESDDEDDELDHLSEADKFRHEKYYYKTDTLQETYDDIGKNTQQTYYDLKVTQETDDFIKQIQCTYDASEAELILDRIRKTELSNFRFGKNRRKNSGENEKLQNSKIEEYDLFYKTNALGFVAANEDSVIRKLKKKGDDTVYQTGILMSKYELTDNVALTNQEKKAESKIRDGSYTFSEKSKEMITSKDEFQDSSNIETSQNERDGSRTQDALSEKALEMLKSKYEHQADSPLEADQIKKAKSRGQVGTSALSEILSQMSRSERNSDNFIHTSRKETLESKTHDVSASTHEKSTEKSKHYTTCPLCKENVKWIDFNMHLPSCAAGSGRCSSCGEVVSSSELKEHIFQKCSKVLQKKYECERPEKLKSRQRSYEQMATSLTSQVSGNERKSKESSESARMKMTRNEEKMHSFESGESFRPKQAFKVEPELSYLHHTGVNVRRGIHDNKESSVENKEKKDNESSKCYSADYVQRWSKWRGQGSDE